MILIDLSGVVLSAVIKQVTVNPNDLSLELVRNTTINRILQFKNKFKSYGDVVICADSSNYWRNDVFEHYKKNRKKARDTSKIDWKLMGEYFETVRQELKNDLPYIYLEIDRCEADDIIAVLSRFFHSPKTKATGSDRIMIVSSDKDMLQLQKYKNIDQFSNAAKKIISDNVKYHLTEHIIRGDSSDGIPNIMSDDDTLVTEGKRQKSISADFIADSLKMKSPEFICPNANALKRYIRNKQLINLESIPDEYVDKIRDEYLDTFTVKYKSKMKMRRSRLFSYLVKHRLTRLMDKLSDF